MCVCFLGKVLFSPVAEWEKRSILNSTNLTGLKQGERERERERERVAEAGRKSEGGTQRERDLKGGWRGVEGVCRMRQK